jgi:hypothetical protein
MAQVADFEPDEDGIVDAEIEESSAVGLSADTARLLLAAAKDALIRATEAIDRALSHLGQLYHSSAWEGLGYSSWSEMWDAEFGEFRHRLSIEQRRATVAAFSSALSTADPRKDMPTSAMAAVFGVSEKTILRDVKVAISVEEQKKMIADKVVRHRNDEATFAERQRKTRLFATLKQAKRSGERITQEQLAHRLGVSQSTINGDLKFLEAHPEIGEELLADPQLAAATFAVGKVEPETAAELFEYHAREIAGPAPTVEHTDLASTLLAEAHPAAARHVADLAKIAAALDHPVWEHDDYFRADLAALIGDDLGAGLCTAVYIAKMVGIDVDATLQAGRTVWVDDPRGRAADHRAWWAWAKAGLLSILQVAQQAGVPVGEVAAAVAAVDALPTDRQLPAQGAIDRDALPASMQGGAS